MWTSAGKPHLPGCQYLYRGDGLSRTHFELSAEGSRQEIVEHMPLQQLEGIQEMLFEEGLLPDQTVQTGLSVWEPHFAQQAARFLPWTQEAMAGVVLMEEEPPLRNLLDHIWQHCEFLAYQHAGAELVVPHVLGIWLAVVPV